MARIKRAVTVLKRARARIEKGWCRSVFAKDSLGRRVDPASETACRWCAVGAMKADSKIASNDVICKAIKSAYHALPPTSCAVEAFNDNQKSKHAVLALFDRAIEFAKQQGW